MIIHSTIKSFFSLANIPHKFPITQCLHSILKQGWQYYINKDFLSGNISANYLKAKILSFFRYNHSFLLKKDIFFHEFVFIKENCIESKVIWRHFLSLVHMIMVTDVYYGIGAYKSFLRIASLWACSKLNCEHKQALKLKMYVLSNQLCACARGLCTRTYTIYNDAGGVVLKIGQNFILDHDIYYNCYI